MALLLAGCSGGASLGSTGGVATGDYHTVLPVDPSAYRRAHFLKKCRNTRLARAD